MSARAAWAASQSDPARNKGFRCWPAPAIGDAVAPIRVWFAPEMPIDAKHTNPVRLRAEREWLRLTRRVAP